MIHSQMEKVVASVPGTVGTSAVTLTVDTLDWDHASFSVLRASNASTAFASVLKVEESDASGSGYSDVTALVGGGVGGFAIPAVSNTAVEAVVKIDVDAKARKRYLKVTATPAVSVNTVITGRLSRGVDAPVTAADAGCIGWVKG
jgi:hypothetical protein